MLEKEKLSEPQKVVTLTEADEQFSVVKKKKKKMVCTSTQHLTILLVMAQPIDSVKLIVTLVFFPINWSWYLSLYHRVIRTF